MNFYKFCIESLLFLFASAFMFVYLGFVYFYSRVTTLAKFLIDGDPQGKLKKSTTDLKKYDPKGLDECRNVATRYCKQLFEIYDKKQDPYFLPS